MAETEAEARDKFIEKTKEIAIRAMNNWAPEADRLGLPVLSREFHHLGRELLGRLELQLKMLQGDLPQGLQ
jgi:hypothetical protein